MGERSSTPSFHDAPRRIRMQARRITRWSPAELRSRRAQGDAILILDVRSPDARIVHPYEIPGSRWLPLSEVVDQAVTLPRDVAIVAYCT